MMKTKINFHMLRLMLIEFENVKRKYPESERMIKPHICPGFDIQLMQPLAVLRYIYGIKTQWSCQGNHNEGIREAYILIAPENKFPKDLELLIKKQGFEIFKVSDYDKEGNITDKFRYKMSSSSNRELTKSKLKIINKFFLKTLNEWAEHEIKKNLNQIKNDSYFSDLVKLYL